VQTAVLFLIFNRPDTTSRVFEAIRKARPSSLYIAADGPRPDFPGEKELCEKVRSIATMVDWPCDVKTLFRDQNLGCRQAVSSAISWYFEHVDSGIILEDDCLPTKTFFRFCGELLERYEDDTRIGMISGLNWGFRFSNENLSYCFSRHGGIWGWATWKRAWKCYAFDLQTLSEEEIYCIRSNMSSNTDYANYYWEEARSVISGELDSWDYLWGIIRYANNFLTIRPSKNLVANIGFGEDSTHTKGTANKLYTSTMDLNFPLTHPSLMFPDKIWDSLMEQHVLGLPNNKFISRLVYKAKRRIKSIVKPLRQRWWK
jgi:hypothetical protein